MPTTIAIESKPVILFGVTTPYDHLYLVKRVTDASGNVVDERVIRGNLASDESLETQADIPLARSEDARGSATLAQRHHTVVDLGGRDPEEVWNLMVQHAVNIDRAELQYGVEAFDVDYGGEVNSNTTVASVLHAVGLNLARNLPAGVEPRDVPLFNRIDAMFVDDALFGGSQNDIILGGVGNDYIRGGGGDDRLLGEVGIDNLAGGAGNDLLDGGRGADVMTGGAGNDTYRIDDRNDRVIEKSTTASGGIDVIVSQIGFSLLGKADIAGVERLSLRGSDDLAGTGNDLDNSIYGNSGDNNLSGRAGNDVLKSGGGDDLLRGGYGSDSIAGGAGADTFVYVSFTESRAGTGIDVILDFDTRDVLDLSGIDANLLVTGNQTFSFIGSGEFTGAGQIRAAADSAGNTVVQADVNGDRTADFEVILFGYAQAITRGDFIL